MLMPTWILVHFANVIQFKCARNMPSFFAAHPSSAPRRSVIGAYREDVVDPILRILKTQKRTREIPLARVTDIDAPVPRRR